MLPSVFSIGPDTSPDAKFVLNANGMAQSSISFGAMSNDPGNNVCQGGVDTVVFFINQPAIVDAGANQTICSSTPTVSLSGSIEEQHLLYPGQAAVVVFQIPHRSIQLILLEQLT